MNEWLKMRITNRHEFARISTKQIAAAFALIVLSLGLSLAKAATAPTTRQSLDSSRLALAMDYGNPNAHLALAKSLNGQGNALTAFLICEHARALFGEEAFVSSFDIVFRGHVTDVLFHARKQMLQTAISLAPRSVEPLKEMAELYAAHGEPADAVSVLRRAIGIAPDDYTLVESLQLDLQTAGQKADAQAMLNDWCRDHPGTPPAWERRVSEALSQNDESASALLDEAIAKFPADGQLHLMRGRFDEEQKPDDAEADFIAAADFAATSASAQGAAGRFFLKTRHDPDRALKYYLAAYFLDPDFNDWESVDQRVGDCAHEVTQERMTAAKASAAGLATLIADPNPLVEIEAMSQISGEWDDRAQDQLLGLTISDCPEVRQVSIQLLIAHPASLVGQKLEGMVRNQNPWTRAAAVSVLAGTRKTAALDQLSPLLADPSVLVRFTCATNLLDPDNGGKAIVIASMRKDPCEWLRNVVAGELAQGSR